MIDRVAEVDLFSTLTVSFDPTLPKGKQYIAKMYLWDHPTRTGTAIISWQQVEGERFQIEGHASPSEAVAEVIAKYERGVQDKVVNFG